MRQRYEGVKNEAGVWITPAFPKLIYVLEDDNISRGLSVSSTSRSWRPSAPPSAWCPTTSPRRRCASYKLSKGETEGNGDCYTCMGCRSFLTPDRSGNGYDNVANAGNYEPGKPKYYGRFNQGVVTINLPDVALLVAAATWTSSGRSSTSAWSCATKRSCAATIA